MDDPNKDDEENGALAVFWNEPEEDDKKDNDADSFDKIRESDQDSGFETVSSHSSKSGMKIEEHGDSQIDEDENSFLPWSITTGKINLI